MTETTHQEESEPTSARSEETSSLESGGTSVSFRPGTIRFLPDRERKPWWLAPGAVVLIPLLVMTLAVSVIPDRIGSSADEETNSFSLFDSKPSSTPASSTASHEPEESDHEEEAPRRSSRVSRETSVRKPVRGFSPVRDRPEPPPSPLPITQQTTPAAPETPLVRMESNRSGQVRSVVPRPEIAEEVDGSAAEDRAEQSDAPIPAPDTAPAEAAPEASPPDAAQDAAAFVEAPPVDP